MDGGKGIFNSIGSSSGSWVSIGEAVTEVKAEASEGTGIIVEAKALLVSGGVPLYEKR